ncbi:MAG TPA: tRNA lysidine(34) synthetase TilS [Bacteroidetes bacterium]|nr:tRNA lysidine(34) synthetase TilS [Bacteroidota bacterium]HIL57593.1 tRNA lysidine(34) synthetase TilS [Rhodothermales bacterium]
MRPDAFSAALDSLGLISEPGVVVGVSGGVDSTVLLHLLHGAGVPVVAVHVDYGLRPESGADAAFVAALAAELGVPSVVRRVALPAEGNRQQAAREARYAVFREVAVSRGWTTVAVGHTATDQAETVLMHWIRGAGAAGLGGMREARPVGEGVRLVRPLLGMSREAVEAVANAQGWTWRDDASNATDAYRRNRVRHHVLPLLQAEGGAGTVERIAAAARRLRTNTDDLGARVERVAERRPGGVALPLAALAVLPERDALAALAWALGRWRPSLARTEPVLRQILSLLDSQPGSTVPLGGTTVWRDRQHLVLGPTPERWEGTAVRLGETTGTPFGTLYAAPVTGAPVLVSSRWREVAAAGALAEPLELRPWREGDRLRPLGLRGEVLVSDLLTNRRVPPSERHRQLVLTSRGEIVWVVGHRLAEAARVREDTAQTVALRWVPVERPGGAG